MLLVYGDSRKTAFLRKAGATEQGKELNHKRVDISFRKRGFFFMLIGYFI